MFFNHRTKQYTGGLFRATPEMLAESRKLIDAGDVVSTEHPSEKNRRIMQKIWSERDITAEEAAAKIAKRRHDLCELKKTVNLST